VSNEFYITVVANRQTDQVMSVHSYTKIGPAKARRTNTIRHRKHCAAKVFKCLYGLGCMTAVELDL
jgi:hypothetical protein